GGGPRGGSGEPASCGNRSRPALSSGRPARYPASCFTQLARRSENGGSVDLAASPRRPSGPGPGSAGVVGIRGVSGRRAGPARPQPGDAGGGAGDRPGDAPVGSGAARAALPRRTGVGAGGGAG